MAYVGNQPAKGQFRKLTDISGSFDGVTTTFTTSVPPGTSSYYVTAGSASQLLVSLGGVIQQPDTDYTVSTNSITFTTAPASGLSFFGVLMGDALNTGTPADGSVTTSKLASDLTVDLASGSVSAPSLTFDANTGLYSPAADKVAISTNGTDAVIVDDSQRFLVGTTTSTNNVRLGQKAAFVSTGGVYNGVSLTSYAGTGAGTSNLLDFQRSRGTSDGSLTIVASGDALGYISWRGSDGSAFVNAASISCEVDGTPGANDMPGRLVFSVTQDGSASPTERVRITNLGQFNAFSANNVSTILGRNSAGAGTSVATYVGVHSATGTTNGTISCYIWSNGNVQNTNGSYTTISDVKLKENIVDAGSQWNDFKAIKIRNWNFKAETGHETHRQIGPIAQELEAVCPGLVFETPDRDAEGNDLGTTTKGVNQSVLYMKAVKALQEAMERIEQLEAKVAALEAA